MHRSGLAELLPSLGPETGHVGVSAGSIVAANVFGETYPELPPGTPEPLSRIRFPIQTDDGPVEWMVATGRGLGLVDFTIMPHYTHPEHREASAVGARAWAVRLPTPSYSIDDRSAVVVVDGKVEVVSDGVWELFQPGPVID